MALSRLSGPQQRGVLRVMTTSPPGCLAPDGQRSSGSGSLAFIPSGGGIDHQLVSDRVVLHQGDIELRIVLMQPSGEGVRHLGPGIVQGQGADSRRRERGGDSRSHPPLPTTSARVPAD